MKLIKINRKTIKVNPDAGSTQTRVFTSKETTFEIKGKMLDCLKDGENCHVTEEGFSGSIFTKGYINNLTKELITEIQKEIKKDGSRINIETKNNSEIIDHLPISKYSYKHFNSLLECKKCKKQTPINAIEWDYPNDDEDAVSVCKCGAFDSFEEHKYESINDIMKN